MQIAHPAHPAHSTHTAPLHAETKPISEMTLVEIAEQLEQVTARIEAERVREREARKIYEAVAAEVESKVQSIRRHAEQLVEHQRRKMQSFDGLFGRPPQPTKSGKPAPSSSPSSAPHSGSHKNIADAIISIWTLDKYDAPLTTEEIYDALAEVGYRSDASPSSLRSSINQALAKLCRVGRVVRFRADGTRIPIKDTSSRARKYLAAIRLPEDE
ncbi:MAG: hypothetical protein HRU70_02445 [Phycisphaeraceae bacterium]|nr:MAG: hypothetical protein HRU70_02445 [Phycisphaeraceae bacterium]